MNRKTAYALASSVTLLCMLFLFQTVFAQQPPERPQTPDIEAPPLIDPRDPEGSKEKNADKIAAYQKALEVIRQIAQAEEKAKWGKAADEAEKALGEGRVRSGGVREGADGATRGDKPNERGMFFPPGHFVGDPNNKEFITWLDSVFHEGWHNIQETWPDPGEVLKPNGMKEKDLIEAIKRKIGRLRMHGQAYDEDLAFKKAIEAALQKIYDQFDKEDRWKDVPDWAKKLWLNSTKDQIKDLLDKASDWVRKKDAIARTIRKLCDDMTDKLDEILEKPKPEDRGLELVALENSITSHQTWKSYSAPWLMVRLSFVLSSSAPVVCLYHGWPVVEFDTGIPHPQDMLMLEDIFGAPHLLVCGVDKEMEPHGMLSLIQVMEAPVMPHYMEEPVLAAEEHRQAKTVLQGNPCFRRFTSLLRAPDGRIFVWDADVQALYELIDITGDGLPDFIDPRRRNFRGPAGSGIDRMAQVSWIGKQPIAEIRHGEVAVADDPIVVFMDPNLDGYFEALLPSRFSQILRIGQGGKER